MVSLGAVFCLWERLLLHVRCVMVGERELEQVVTVREIWAFLPKKCGGEVSLCCLGIRRSRFPHGNLCVVREIPSFYTTANYLRCSSKPHDFQGKSQAGLTGPA